MTNQFEQYERITALLKTNATKIMYAGGMLITLFLLVSFIFAIPLFAALIPLAEQQPLNFGHVALASIFIPLGYALMFVFLYGFFVLLIRMYKNDYVTIGFIFYGFKDFKRLIRLGLLFSLLYIFSMVLAGLPVLGLALTPVFSKIPLELLIFPLVFAGIVLFVILLLPYVFTLFYVYESHGSNVPIFPLLKKSIFELKGKKLALFKMCAGYVYKDIFAALILLIASVVLKVGFLSFGYTVFMYSALIKAILVLAAFYYNLQTQRLEAV